MNERIPVALSFESDPWNGWYIDFEQNLVRWKVGDFRAGGTGVATFKEFLSLSPEKLGNWSWSSSSVDGDVEYAKVCAYITSFLALGREAFFASLTVEKE